MTESLTLGVLGGMGPAATLDFLAKIQAFTPAKSDQDHIRVIVDINPKAPDRNVPGNDVGLVLAEMAGGLRGAGAEVLAIACNTAHAHADLIQRASGLPLIDMIDLGAEARWIRSAWAWAVLDGIDSTSAPAPRSAPAISASTAPAPEPGTLRSGALGLMSAMTRMWSWSFSAGV